VVKVLSKGAKPRSPLVYDFSSAVSERTRLSMRMKMTMGMEGMALPETPPIPLIMDVDIRPDCVTREGSLRYTFEFVAIELGQDPALDMVTHEAVQSELGRLVGMNGWALVSTSGLELASALSPPAGMDPSDPLLDNMNESMNNVSSPFPTTAVGIGATWTVEQHVSNARMSLDQKAAYTLLSLEGGRATLEVRLEQSAPKQEMNLGKQAMMGATAHLDSLATQGAGSMQVDLARVVPRSSLKTHTDTRMTISVGGMSQPMVMSMDMDLGIEPGEPRAEPPTAP
jgi:hypothetical protein